MRLKTNQKERLRALLDFDAQYFSKETLIIGLDEVGRGCFAGPVVTAAFAYDSSSRDLLAEGLTILDDSKKLRATTRQEIVKDLEGIPTLSFDFCFYPATEVDRRGIVNCIWASMLNNLRTLLGGLERDYNNIIILVDGPRKIKGFELLLQDFEQVALEHYAIVRGDSKSAAIAAASNIAKVKRDNYMQELARDYPQYHWETNVGYGTAKHREAIKHYGLTDYHRRSFCRGCE